MFILHGVNKGRGGEPLQP
eukprot:UN10184